MYWLSIICIYNSQRNGRCDDHIGASIFRYVEGQTLRKLKDKNRSRLIQSAMGKIPCDLIVKNVQYFNVFTGEIYPAEVDVLDGFVVRVRQVGEHSEMPAKSVYDGQGRYLIPGYIDTHMHVESTMMIPENLSRAILPWGTTTICTDPHEIGNVMGVEGIRFMLGNAKKSALRQYVLAPSCVPAVPELESTGTSFGAKEVGEILDMDDVVGIAEIMDFVGVYQAGDWMHSIIDEGIKRGMYLQDHAPYVSGKELAAYRLGGPCSDHESATAEEVVEKLRCDIHVNLRASSLIDNLKTLVAGCRNHQWKDMVSICTDDVHAKDLLTVGHINKGVRKAVQAGISGCEAIKLATFNAAREYGFDDLGAVLPAISPICRSWTPWTAASLPPCSWRAGWWWKTALTLVWTTRKATMTSPTPSTSPRSIPPTTSA